MKTQSRPVVVVTFQIDLSMFTLPMNLFVYYVHKLVFCVLVFVCQLAFVSVFLFALVILSSCQSMCNGACLIPCLSACLPGHMSTCQQGWEFAHRFSERIARFLPKNEQMSDFLKKTSDSLIRSFLVSDLNHVSYSILCTQCTV